MISINLSWKLLIFLHLIQFNFTKCNLINNLTKPLDPVLGIMELLDNHRTGSSELWTFNVKVNRSLAAFEAVALTGNHESLGNWNPENGILLKREQSDNWKGTVKLTDSQNIQYRYFIVAFDQHQHSSGDGNTIIRFWESSVWPRKLSSAINKGKRSVNDVFGVYGADDDEISDKRKISRGWLNGQTIIQLKFSRNPFTYNKWTDHSLVGVRVTPIAVHSNQDDLTSEVSPKNRNQHQTIVEVSKLKFNHSELVLQENNETLYRYNDMIIFHITLSNLDKIAYQIDLSHSDINEDENQISLGYQYILPSDIKGSEGDLELPIISSNESIPIGFMRCSYLVIRSMKSLQSRLNLRTSFTRHWQTNWTNIDFGHRGLGVSFKYLNNTGPPAIENTVASLKQAGLAGADGVEFDVHLTKDLLPVIYHDFHIYANFKSGKVPTNQSDLMKIPIKDLTYNQLKAMRTYQIVDNQIIEYPSHNEEKRKDYRLFPLLEDFFTQIDPSIGFDIEIKWPQKLENGQTESVQTIDKNLFADRILNVILQKGCGRFIFMSCFDADLCTMLRFKQNMYPVMFLSVGDTRMYNRYLDPRCQSIENAVTNAETWELLGAVPHTQDYVDDSSLAELANSLDQVSFCWGSNANSTEAVDEFKRIGLTGVIYDRIDRLLPGSKNESIFKNEQDKRLFQMQCIS